MDGPHADVPLSQLWQAARQNVPPSGWLVRGAVIVEVVDRWRTVRMHSWVGKPSRHTATPWQSPPRGADLRRAPEAVPPVKRSKAELPRRSRLGGTWRSICRVSATRATPTTARDSKEASAASPPPSSSPPAMWWPVSASPAPLTRINDSTIPIVATDVRRAARQASLRLGSPRQSPDWPAKSAAELPHLKIVTLIG
jgi:hypothetical protein